MNIVVAQAAVSPAANTLNGQGWHQAAELGVALLLSAAIGLDVARAILRNQRAPYIRPAARHK